MPELIDLPAFASALGRAVHDAGVPVTPERSVRLAQALSLAPPVSKSRLYWSARTVFVSGHEQVPTFDRVFAAVFEGWGDPAAAHRGDPNAPPPTGARAGTRPPRP